MKNLIEISKIVTKKKVRKIEIFDDNSLRHKNSKFNEFYESLMGGKFKNDRDASTALYGCSPTDDKYRQLKSRFRKRLLNTLFFLDINVPSTSNYDRAYYTVNKDWTLVKILLSNNANFTAATLARQILTIALKFQFADIIVNWCRILRKEASLTNDEKAFEEYDQYIKQYSNILDAEIRSEELYQRVIINYYKPYQKTTSLREKIDTYCDALIGLSEIYESPVVIYNMYLVWAYRHEMLYEFESLLDICNRAENYITENPLFHQEEKLTTFNLKKMSSFLHLRDYKRGKINAEKCLISVLEGSEKWFEFLEYYILLCFHTQNFENAYAIHTKATTNNKFKSLSTSSKEKWYCYEAYLNVLSDIDEDGGELKNNINKKNFKLNKFVLDPILHHRELRILTVHLVIAQILYYLKKRSYGNVTEKIERLKGYSLRQLKKEDYFRTTQFIRLLQQLLKSGYKSKNLSNTEKYYNRLLKHKFYYRGLLSEIEIIPYENVWDLILKIIN
ncbi:MAG: hypothetical protein IPL95_12660 [Saprospiraceae bacterium]|nr:hypothetical protein [Saprospiraceae bacterium]